MSQDQTHVLLWSQSQCALHVEPIEDMLQANRAAYAENRRMDYVPIVVGPSQLCEEAAEAVRNTMHARLEARTHADVTDVSA